MALHQPRRPSLANHKVRIGIYGAEGTGKTHFGLTFPEPLVVNCEDSADAFADRGIRYGVVDTTCAADAQDAFFAILNRTPGFECGTVLFDSATAFIRMCQQEPGGRKEQYKNSTVYARSTQLLSRIYNGQRPCHVVVTAHEKVEFENQQAVGATWDCDPRFGYPFDVIVRMGKNGNKRVALIEKSRFRMLPEGALIENFSWTHVQAALVDAAEHADAQPKASVLDRLVALHESVGKPNGSLREYVIANGLEAKASVIEKNAQAIATALKALKTATPAADGDSEPLQQAV
jgi:hypothetical protein